MGRFPGPKIPVDSQTWDLSLHDAKRPFDLHSRRGGLHCTIASEHKSRGTRGTKLGPDDGPVYTGYVESAGMILFDRIRCIGAASFSRRRPSTRRSRATAYKGNFHVQTDLVSSYSSRQEKVVRVCVKRGFTASPLYSRGQQARDVLSTFVVHHPIQKFNVDR